MILRRDFYNSTISEFLQNMSEEILKSLLLNSDFPVEKTQRYAWEIEIDLLKKHLINLEGNIHFEFNIPRMGKRIDVVAIVKNIVFVFEFKVAQKSILTADLDQVWDYCLDLKNFHETSHDLIIAPVLVATSSQAEGPQVIINSRGDNVLEPIYVDANAIRSTIESIIEFCENTESTNQSIDWGSGRYSPTPSIIEAAAALYRNHSVADITRSDANATQLKSTSKLVLDLIHQAKERNEKIICFVTGVPGAGKTLIGLDVATQHMDAIGNSSSVFLSGNGPLVAILREALTRDKVANEKLAGRKVTKGEVRNQVKAFIQNVHHFRDEYLKDNTAPHDHVAIFDEAQRAWNHEQTARFMKAKKGQPDFAYSEPEFLISCLDRHQNWAVVVCLVGGGQEINTGEAGISEWFDSVYRTYKHWKVFVAPNIEGTEYNCADSIKRLIDLNNLTFKENLHLSVSMRSFRAEHLSTFVKCLLDKDVKEAKEHYNLIKHKFPLAITRDSSSAKRWLKSRARGTERYGIVVSSQAYRLKPLAIDVRSTIDPIHWFLDGKEDVRSSYYLEDVATEFHVQGLELDWACVTWDGDLRSSASGWNMMSFVGSKWNKIRKPERQLYLKNAYRVLLTRARQGMIIHVPEGDPNDPTRLPEIYDPTFEYLASLGIPQI
jgi:DUF2075 family protein